MHMHTHTYMGVSKNRGTPKSSILIGFSIINQPFWGTTIFGNTHISIHTHIYSPFQLTWKLKMGHHFQVKQPFVGPASPARLCLSSKRWVCQSGVANMSMRHSGSEGFFFANHITVCIYIYILYVVYSTCASFLRMMMMMMMNMSMSMMVMTTISAPERVGWILAMLRWQCTPTVVSISRFSW